MRANPFDAKLAVAIVVLAMTSARSAYSADETSLIELVRQTVQNEIKPGDGKTKAMFVDHKTISHGSETRFLVETREGTAGLTVAINGIPLTQEQRSAEGERVLRLAKNPEQLKKKQKGDKEDAEHTIRIMKALPDAFLYEPDGTAVGSTELGKAGDRLVCLKFRPNPKYDPPTHVEQVLTGMQGELVIDTDQHRIAKIDGTLVKDVGFGWGILGRLDRGGHFLVQQAEVIPGEWEVTHMSLSFYGKELLFKSFSTKSDEVFTDFRPAPPNLTFAEGVELLKKQGAELAENWQQPGADSPK